MSASSLEIPSGFFWPPFCDPPPHFGMRWEEGGVRPVRQRYPSPTPGEGYLCLRIFGDPYFRIPPTLGSLAGPPPPPPHPGLKKQPDHPPPPLTPMNYQRARWGEGGPSAAVPKGPVPIPPSSGISSPTSPSTQVCIRTATYAWFERVLQLRRYFFVYWGHFILKKILNI